MKFISILESDLAFNKRISYLLAILLGCVLTHETLSAQDLAKEFEIQTQPEVTLLGTLRLPDNPVDNAPLVVLLSGSGPQNRDASNMRDGYSPSRTWAQAFASAGIASWRYDERGIGSSGGKWSEMTFDEHVSDIVSMIEVLRKERGVDASRIILLGHSEGALLAAAVSEKVPPIAAILLSPPGEPFDELLFAQAISNTPRGDLSEDEYNQAVQKTLNAFLVRARSVPNIASILELEPAAIYRKMLAPTLIVHGGADPQVPPSNSAAVAKALIEASEERYIEMRILPRLGHLLLPVSSEQTTLPNYLVDDVVHWSAQQVVRREAMDKAHDEMP